MYNKWFKESYCWEVTVTFSCKKLAKLKCENVDLIECYSVSLIVYHSSKMMHSKNINLKI